LIYQNLAAAAAPGATPTPTPKFVAARLINQVKAPAVLELDGLDWARVGNLGRNMST
jgi:hypothetical protein